MITYKDIQREIGLLLTKGGFFVAAIEVSEGSRRPVCTIDVFPSETEILNGGLQEDSFEVQILYYPETDKREELLEAAEKLKQIILNQPVKCDDRVIPSYSVKATASPKTSASDSILSVETEYNLIQARDLEEMVPDMKELFLDVFA